MGSPYSYEYVPAGAPRSGGVATQSSPPSIDSTAATESGLAK